MKCSLGISNFLEQISSFSHSIVFLSFFALIAEEGFLISPCYFFGTLHSNGYISPFLLCFSLLFFPQLFRINLIGTCSGKCQGKFLVFVLVAQLWTTLCDPMEYSLPGSSVHGILQARILEWVAISFSKGSSQPRDWTWVSHFAGTFFTSEPSGKFLVSYHTNP